MILLSAAESRELDRLSQARYGVPSYALMTRAGEAVARAIARRWPDALANGVLVIAGKGNNGGDGFVAARALLQSGVRTSVILLSRVTDLKGDAARAHADYVFAMRGAFSEVVNENVLDLALKGQHPGVVVDAIFGTGLNAEVMGLPRRVIEAIPSLGAPTVAVDVASGVNSDTGAVMGAAVKAALTVTFGYAKFGHVSYPGAELCGELEIAQIGFAEEAIDEIAPRGRLLERAEVAPIIRPRAANTHKGTYGHALVIAGSRGKSGAAILTSRGALRAGAGLVTVAIPQCVSAIVAAGQTELMTEAMPDRDGHFDAVPTITQLEHLVSGKSVLIAGPGLGISDDTRRLVEWLAAEGAQADRPMLLDADALNALATAGPAILKAAHGPVVLTPHPGEMARLLGSTTALVNANRIGAARQLAALTRAGVLLKGARTVIAMPAGAVYVNSNGNAGMATPGMGDVLSGIIGALLGQGYPPDEALCLGAFAHGYAADRLAERVAAVGYLAGEVADEIPAAIAALSPVGV